MSAANPIELEASCCMCAASAKVIAPLPEGWRTRYSVIYEEAAFCPDHAIIESFLEEQCPGCIAGWPQCPMFNAFAYADNITVTAADYETLESGVCPRRVSGTMMVSRSDAGAVAADWVDLSSPAVEGGVALAEAVRAYVEDGHE